MIPRIRSILPLLAALLAAAPAAAQTVQGTLREPGGAPVDRVLVVLLDAGGTQVTRTLTGADGGFVLRAPAAGSYSLRAERIGYSAVTTGAFELRAGETRTEQLVASGAAVMLAGLTVTPASRQCRVRPGAGLATATLWEEARKALNAAAFSQSSGMFRYDLNVWAREIDPDDNTVRHEDRQTGTDVEQLPFRSLPPAELSRQGYVQKAAGDSTSYWGPDAAVLMSTQFLNDHCLRVVEGSDPALIGLGFEPVRGRRVPDIRGTLWLDRRSSELRRVEYAYQGGPPETEDRRVGGAVEYERLAGGPWIVRRWTIRMPQMRSEDVLRAVQTGGRTSNGLTLVPRRSVVMSALLEAGGEVTGVSTTDGRPVLAARAVPVVRGVVWDSTRAAPAAGAMVYLSGTQASTESGADGSFVLPAPGEGRYTVAFSVPSLGPVGATGRTATVALKAGDTATVALAVPGWRTAISAICADSTLRREPGVVIGRVTGPGADRSTVTASWFGKGYTARSAGFTRSAVATNPDAHGFYVLCGVTTQAAVTVRAQTSTARGEAEVHPSYGGAPARADVEMRETTVADRMVGVTEQQLPARAAASAPAATATVRPATSLRTFELMVKDTTGRPVAHASVRIGPRPPVETDEQGRARTAVLPSGEYPVWMMDPVAGVRMGRVTVPADLASIELRTGATGQVSATARGAVALAPVEARSAARVASLEANGFYARRQRGGGGIFLTDSVIQTNQAGRLTDVLRGVQGVRMMRYYPAGGQRGAEVSEQYRIASGRNTTGISRAGPCWMDVYLDGQLVQSHDDPDQARNLDQMGLRDIQAVEVYRGGSEVPTEYRGSSSACGVILIWTRR